MAYPSRGYQCYQITAIEGFNFFRSLAAAPSSINLEAPPVAGDITGQDMSGANGMPRVDYFDSDGYLIGSVAATSVAANGTSLNAPTPDLSSVYSGNYEIVVTNKRADGEYLDRVGSAPIYAWGRDRLDSDGDGWYDDEDCYPYDSWRWDCNAGCCEPGCREGCY